MTSQPGYQIITIQILPNISRCKGNQTMKNWSVNTVTITKEIIFFKTHSGNLAKRLVLDLFLFFQKLYFR